MMKMVTAIAITPVMAFLMLILFGLGGPIIFLMFFGMYFVIGPFLQVCVRIHPQEHKANQPTPWAQFFGVAFTMVLRTGAVLAVFRLLFHLFGRSIVYEEGHLLLRSEVDYFFAGCGLLYAFLSFLQEGLWRYRQVLAVRELATAPVGSAAAGLAELTGIVRRQENRDGPIESGHVIMHFYWQILGTHRMGDSVMLGTYDKEMNPFYLEDETGRILVDPVHDDVELRRPLGSVFTTFFGRRSFEIVLTKDVEQPSWDQRHYYLREGDRVHVIGSVEMNEKAPRDAVDADRLIVRPRHQARSGYESLLQFLIPGKTPSRSPHDIFVIADTDEAGARGILMNNFRWSASFSLILAVISVLLIITAGQS